MSFLLVLVNDGFSVAYEYHRSVGVRAVYRSAGHRKAAQHAVIGMTVVVYLRTGYHRISGAEGAYPVIAGRGGRAVVSDLQYVTARKFLPECRKHRAFGCLARITGVYGARFADLMTILVLIVSVMGASAHFFKEA